MKLTNQTAVRRYALDVIKQERPGLSDKFTRVGSEFFEAVEAATRAGDRPIASSTTTPAERPSDEQHPRQKLPVVR
jgi:hypothetical protein